MSTAGEEHDNEIHHIIWANVLEALDYDSANAMHAAREFADRFDNPAEELLLIFCATAGLLGRFIERHIGPDATREEIHLMLFESDLATPPTATEPGGEL